MERWTLQQLKETDDLTFAVAILDERRRCLSEYSPLRKKIQEAMFTLNQIKMERDFYIAKVAAMDLGWVEDEPESEDDDFSDCPDEVKDEIIRNAELLEEREDVTSCEEGDYYDGETGEQYAV